METLRGSRTVQPLGYSDPELRARIGHVRVPIEELHSSGILVDPDEGGYLLQIFTQAHWGPPAVSFKMTERHGSHRLRQRQPLTSAGSEGLRRGWAVRHSG
jgi:hypothetical protein